MMEPWRIMPAARRAVLGPLGEMIDWFRQLMLGRVTWAASIRCAVQENHVRYVLTFTSIFSRILSTKIAGSVKPSGKNASTKMTV